MSVNPVPEEELRAALRPYQVDPSAFEAGVRTKLEAAEKQQRDEPLARLSPWLRSAAAFLPLEALAGCSGTATAAKAAPAGFASKLLGYLAFPAISLFVLLGATIVSILRIRTIRNQPVPGLSDRNAFPTAMQTFGWRLIVGGQAVFLATLLLTWLGAAWLVFVVYIISFGVLLQVLTALAKQGLGNRLVISQFCSQGLLFLGIASQLLGRNDQEVHFLDQSWIWMVIFGGVWVLIFVSVATIPLTRQQTPGLGSKWALVALLMGPLVMAPLLMNRGFNLIVWPVTPTQIKHHVESFDQAPFNSASWQHWEIVARWAIDARLDPDFTKPRQLLAAELAGEQSTSIVGSALRVGLLEADQLGQLRSYDLHRRVLMSNPPRSLKPQFAARMLEQQDWLIRAAVLRNDLSSQDRDRLAERLRTALDGLSEQNLDVLKSSLRFTRLLEAIERPIDRDQYRGKIHELLRTFHSNQGGGFQPPGGFKQMLSTTFGSVEATAYGVELMEIYGVPADLDMNSVRSFLKPSRMQSGDQKWIAAAALDRLNHLAGAPPRPSWMEILYHERTLLAAVILVGLCLYATFSAPLPKLNDGATGSASCGPKIDEPST